MVGYVERFMNGGYFDGLMVRGIDGWGEGWVNTLVGG